MEKNYKHILVAYSKFVNSYKEYTAIIVDSNNNIVDSIDLLFDKGEYSKESIDKMSKYSIKGITIDENKDLYMFDNSENISHEEALTLYMDSIETLKRVEEFLTPEKEQELLDLFKNR